MQENLCSNCFAVCTGNVCRQCGYDPASDAGKYPLALKPGSILGGRYILGRTLGQGGFGITYLAKDVQVEQRVAIKEFFPETMVTRTGSHSVTAFTGQREEHFQYGLKCFLAEAQTMAQFLGVDTIAQVFSYFEENGTAYFVMEYVDGISLQGHLKDRGGRISWEETAGILFPVMDALSLVHEKGIIHRDIAPDNIYITKDGNVKLLDFGSARYSLGDKSRSLDVILKHGFAPKEQYTRRGRQGPYTDVYSMAATFYFCLTGHPPPEAIDRMDEEELMLPSALGAELPEAAEAGLEKALAFQAADRFQSMAEFKMTLMPEVLPEEEPVAVEPEEIPEETPVVEEIPVTTAVPAPEVQPPAVPKAVQKKKFPWGIAAAAAVVAVGAGAFLLLSGTEQPEKTIQAAPAAVVETTVPVAETTAPEPDWLNTAPKHKLMAAYGDKAQGYWILECNDDGTVNLLGKPIPNGEALIRWQDIVSVEIGEYYLGNDWENNVSIQAVGQKADGTVVTTGQEGPDWKLSQWRDIQAIGMGEQRVVGLKTDGTVVMTGDTSAQISMGDWADIADIAVCDGQIVGLKKDGTVESVYAMTSDWTDITAVAAAPTHVAGLKADGTVVTTGTEDVSSWKDIVAIAAGDWFTIGLKADGTVVAEAALEPGTLWDHLDMADFDLAQATVAQVKFAQWQNIAAIEVLEGKILALRADGEVEAAGPELGLNGKLLGWKQANLPDGVHPAEEAGLTGVIRQQLNIRAEPSIASTVVGSYSEGDVVTIYEFTEDGWARTDKGWIVLSYVSLEE